MEQVLSATVGQSQRGRDRAEQREGAVKGSMWGGEGPRRETETSEWRCESVRERIDRSTDGQRGAR